MAEHHEPSNQSERFGAQPHERSRGLSDDQLEQIAGGDVCGSVGGRHLDVGGCTDVPDAVAEYVPPPSDYAPCILNGES
jgi:hypothetical protein